MLSSKNLRLAKDIRGQVCQDKLLLSRFWTHFNDKFFSLNLLNNRNRLLIGLIQVLWLFPTNKKLFQLIQLIGDILNRIGSWQLVQGLFISRFGNSTTWGIFETYNKTLSVNVIRRKKGPNLAQWWQPISSMSSRLVEINLEPYQCTGRTLWRLRTARSSSTCRPERASPWGRDGTRGRRPRRACAGAGTRGWWRRSTAWTNKMQLFQVVNPSWRRDSNCFNGWAQ